MQMLAPIWRLVSDRPGRRRSGCACTNGTCRRAWISSVCEVLGVQAASFVQRCPAFGGQAFDARLDGDAAGFAQQAQHVRLPQVDPGLHPELHIRAATSASSSGALGQEDLVDEIQVAHALRDQAVDLGLAGSIGRGGDTCRGSRSWRRSCSRRGSRATPRPRRREPSCGRSKRWWWCVWRAIQCIGPAAAAGRLTKSRGRGPPVILASPSHPDRDRRDRATSRSRLPGRQ